MNSIQLIELLGGTAETSRICEVSMAAVSQWKLPKNGIPKSQLKFLKLLRPDLFKKES
jgi:hypothetical protein